MAARKELKRRAASVALAPFVTYTYPAYSMGWFHEELCMALDKFLADMVAKKSPRLIVCCPPRSGKSELVSRRFPAYALGRYPNLEITGTSYSGELATSFSRDVQNIISDTPYKEVFNTRIPEKGEPSGGKVKRSDYFEVVGDIGKYRAVGVGGSLTGTGCNCLTASAKVLTPFGYRSITNIRVGDPVVAYNETNDQLEVCYVEATKESYSEEIYRLCDDRGGSIEVTGDHPVYTGRSYLKASLLTEGSSLLHPVWSELCDDGVRVPQVGQEGVKEPLLFCEMFRDVFLGAGEGNAQMCGLRGTCKEDATVLRQLPTETSPMANGNGEQSDRVGMPCLRKDVYGGSPRGREVCDVLLERLQEQSSIRDDERVWQCKVQGRRGQSSLQTRGVTCGVSREEECRETGLDDVCGLWSNCGSAPSSCGLRCDKQQICKCRNALRDLSQRGSQARGTRDVFGGYVTSNTRVPLEPGQKVKVYDIQVSGCHNFFANGILVHNCLIVDDPHKDRAEAQSETIRQGVWDWFTSTAYTRVAPGGGVIVMCTRWHLDDLVGRLLEQEAKGGEHWEVFNYPAIAEFDEEHRATGEALHPERYPIEALERIRKSVGERDWNALYQQHPVPDGGGIFKKDWIRRWTPTNLPVSFDRVLMSWDMTFKDTSKSDYVVGQVWGKKGANHYLLDQVRGQWSFTKTKEMFVELCKKWPRATRKLIEDKANGPAIISEFKDVIAGIVPVTPEDSKEARAHAVTTLWEAGNVYIPEQSQDHPWVAEFETELLSFPAGAHDDMIDSCTQALSDFNKHAGFKVHSSNLNYINNRGLLR